MLTNDYKTRRLLLRSYPAEETVRTYADEHGWAPAGSTEEDPDAATVHELMWMVEPSLVVHYAEDRMTSTSYVLASSWSPEQAEVLAARLERDLQVQTLGELIRDCDVAQNDQAIALAINRLTLGAPREYDVDVFTRVCRGLSHPSGHVRLSTVWAVGFMPWPEYRPVLKKLAKKDPDEMVKGTVADLLEAYRIEGGEP